MLLHDRRLADGSRPAYRQAGAEGNGDGLGAPLSLDAAHAVLAPVLVLVLVLNS
jgi:hypothetical protein